MSFIDSAQRRPMTGGASFSLANRVWRVIWSLGWLLLARFTPPPLHPWRRLVLRIAGARVGSGARVHASVRIWDPRNLDLGRDVLIGPGAILYNQGRITVGAGSVVSQRAHICASTHLVDDPDLRLVLRPIEIGEKCWVAAEAFVGPGVTMHPGSVLGARGALFTDAEMDTVYRGNPAIAIRATTRRQGAAT